MRKEHYFSKAKKSQIVNAAAVAAAVTRKLDRIVPFEKERIMKRILMSILLILLLSVPAIADTLTAETAAKGIIGSWKLLSFEREGQPATNSEDKEHIWTFDGEKFRVRSEDLGGEIHDSYRLLRSWFRIRTTIIIFVIFQDNSPT